jgi:hypothetical protein
MDTGRTTCATAFACSRRHAASPPWPCCPLAIASARTADLSVTNALLTQDPAYDNADASHSLATSPGLNVPQDWFSTGQYLDIKTDNTTFERVTAAIGASFNLTGDGRPERVDGRSHLLIVLPDVRREDTVRARLPEEEINPARTLSVILTPTDSGNDASAAIPMCSARRSR